MTKKDPNKKGLWERRVAMPQEALFLKGRQYFMKDMWRLARIYYDYIRGFWAFRNIERCATVFGSSRFEEDHHYYGMARELGGVLANRNFTVMTGGGPGIMEATNRGAKEAGGLSIGCNIDLVAEENPNHYLDRFIVMHYFFVRKMMLTKYSSCFIFMPGGFGTMDEFFEVATLVQTEKIRPFPLVLMGREYWAPLITYLKGMLLARGTIEPEDLDLFFVTDSPEEAVQYIENSLRHDNDNGTR